MKLTNTTKYADYFLRRMVSWCARQLSMPVNKITSATFCNRNHGQGVNGRAYLGSYRILIRIARDESGYPKQMWNTTVEGEIPDHLACIVYVTAHEVQHLVNCEDGTHYDLIKNRDMEPHCDRAGKRVMLAFVEERDKLVAEWSVVPEKVAAKAMPKDPRVETVKLIAKIESRVKQLNTKQKRVETAIKKQTKRLNYYRRKLS